MASAMERTRARSSGSAGSSGGCGWRSFRYSMIASDCDSTTPSTASAGIRPCGLSARYSSVRCSLRAKCFGADSYGSSLRLSAMRTRNAAELRKNVYSYMPVRSGQFGPQLLDDPSLEHAGGDQRHCVGIVPFAQCLAHLAETAAAAHDFERGGFVRLQRTVLRLEVLPPEEPGLRSIEDRGLRHGLCLGQRLEQSLRVGLERQHLYRRMKCEAQLGPVAGRDRRQGFDADRGCILGVERSSQRPFPAGQLGDPRLRGMRALELVREAIAEPADRGVLRRMCVDIAARDAAEFLFAEQLAQVTHVGFERLGQP